MSDTVSRTWKKDITYCKSFGSTCTTRIQDLELFVEYHRTLKSIRKCVGIKIRILVMHDSHGRHDALRRHDALMPLMGI